MEKEMRLIHPDGWKFVGIFIIVSLGLFIFSSLLGLFGLLLTAWCLYFFRNPGRVTCEKESFVTSPADGKIVAITKVVPHESLHLGQEEKVRISIFLNIFDVHVNRIPVSGRILRILYHQGKFFHAQTDKASHDNERNTLIIETSNNQIVGCTQIAGFIARRIRCDVKENDLVKKGAIFGLIRFGSRVDVYLPLNSRLLVLKGQRTIAGETILADLSSPEDNV